MMISAGKVLATPRLYRGRTFLFDWIVPISISVFLVATSFYNFLLFHTLAELFAVMVAVMLCAVSWHTYSFTRNDFLMYLGCGYLWIGMLDLAHVFVFKGMNIFPAHKTELSIQFWIGTRYLEALLLFSAPLFLRYRINRYFVISLFGLIAVSLSAIIIKGYFPVTYIEGQGLTPFKIYSEYIIVMILALAIAHLWTQRALLDLSVARYMVAAMLTTILVELSLTLYSTIDASPMVIGHILKFLSFWLIYLAIIRTMLKDPFRSIFRDAFTYDAIPDATIAVDGNGIIQQANHAACRLAGLDKSEIIGNSSHHVFHAGIAEKDHCPVCALSRHADRSSSLAVRASDSGDWYDFSLAPMTGPSDLEGQVVTIRNITRKKQTELALQETEKLIRQSEQRFQDMVRNIPGIVFQYAVSPNGTVSFPYISPKVQDILKLSPTDVIHDSRSITNMVHAEDRSSFENTMRDSRESLVPWLWEGRMLKGNRNLGWFRVSAMPRKQDDGTVVWNGLFMDISDLKLAEQELKQHRGHLEELVDERTHELAVARDEAMQAIRTRTLFLGNMSYQLRTPLNSIIGFTALLRNNQDDPVNQEQKYQLDMIHESASHLLSLINGILDLSNLETGSTAVRKEDVDLPMLLEETLNVFRQAAETRGLDVFLDNTSTPRQVYTDRSKLRQILLNLIDNAVRYTASGSVTVRGDTNDSGLAIEITDTGTGIAPQDIDHIFDLFGQPAGNPMLHSRQAPGLGLAISRRYAELLGGRIDVRSTPGQGSTFTVYLPEHPAAISELSSDGVATSQQDSGNTTVLVVDNDPEFLELMQAYLDEYCEVITCRNANEVVFMAKRFKPSFVTIDILMPYIDGWTVLTELKTDEETCDIPVIVISSYDDKGKSSLLGAACVLKKPVSRESLLGCLALGPGTDES